MNEYHTNSLSMTKATELLKRVQPYEFVVIVTHDTPDADGIAASWAIKLLIDEETNCDTRVIAGGEILRSENRRLLELLEPPIELLEEYFVVSNVALIFVDCEPTSSRHLMETQLFDPVAVIHHHALPNTDVTSAHPPIVDIRTKVSSASAIAASYLIELGIEPGEKLATALLHGLRSETRGCNPSYEAFDRSVLEWLMTRANLSMLGDIENAPLPREYFGDFVHALQSCTIHGDTAFCMLPHASCPETIGEVADLLVRLEGLNRVLCAATHNHRVLLSARTEPGGGNATRLLQQTIDRLGLAAGHTYRSSAMLSETSDDTQIAKSLPDELLTKWLKACDVHEVEGTKLVKRDEAKGMQ
ncbi:MAG: DHH family phosphoesterase [Pirellulaceae bacterium]